MIWYSFKPTDTLFFKGSVVAEKGENHEAQSIFPPTPHTISGAIRTTILRQMGIPISEYAKGNVSPDIGNAIGKAGAPAPFDIIGPFMRKENDYYIPTPYIWFVDKDLKNENIYVAKPINSSLLVYPNEKKYWTKGKDSELECIGGEWININKILNPQKSDILNNEDFFVPEVRTGNALQVNRRVHEGRLYSFTHIRLKNDVELVFGLNKQLPMNSKGVLTLGGEQRFGKYIQIEGIKLNNGSSGLFMSLTLSKAKNEYKSSLIATGKLIYRGGWDLHRGFHKPIEAYYPAGSVFDTKINENMIEL